MMSPKERLRIARERSGYASPTEAARDLAEININTITSHENGNRPISRKAAERYSRLFNVSAGWILFGEPEEAHNITVPLKGRVGAGQAVEKLDNEDIEYVEAPRDANQNTIAVEVSGDSMHPAYENGTLLYYSKILPPQDLVNRRCVIQLQDGRLFVKVLRTGANAGLWTLQSLNSLYPDIEDVAVDWAAPIDWIKPRRSA